MWRSTTAEDNLRGKYGGGNTIDSKIPAYSVLEILHPTILQQFYRVIWWWWHYRLQDTGLQQMWNLKFEYVETIHEGMMIKVRLSTSMNQHVADLKSFNWRFWNNLSSNYDGDDTMQDSSLHRTWNSTSEDIETNSTGNYNEGNTIDFKISACSWLEFLQLKMLEQFLKESIWRWHFRVQDSSLNRIWNSTSEDIETNSTGNYNGGNTIDFKISACSRLEILQLKLLEFLKESWWRWHYRPQDTSLTAVASLKITITTEVTLISSTYQPA